MNFIQTSILMMLLSISSFFISCTQNDLIIEEDTCVEDNYTITLGRYIKKMNRTPVNNQSAVRTSEFKLKRSSLSPESLNIPLSCWLPEHQFLSLIHVFFFLQKIGCFSHIAIFKIGHLYTKNQVRKRIPFLW